MSRDERNTLDRVALALVEHYSWSQEKVRELFGHASYSVPSNTLSNWLHRAESAGAAVPHGSGVGHVKLLDEKMQDLLSGFILQKNVEAKEVHLQTAVNFLRPNARRLSWAPSFTTSARSASPKRCCRSPSL